MSSSVLIKVKTQLACAYAVLLVYGALLPFKFHAQTLQAAAAEFIERAAIDIEQWSLSDIATNVLLYLPLGFLCCAHFRRRQGSKAAVGYTMLLCVGLSLSTEFLQAWQKERFCSGFDTAMNVAGGLAGAIAQVCLAALRRYKGLSTGVLRRAQLQRWWNGRYWLSASLVYACWLVWLFLSPFDLQFTTECWEEMREGLFTFPFSELQRRSYGVALLLMVQKFLLFMPLGFMLVASMSRVSKTSAQSFFSVRIAALGVCVLAFGIEICQAFLGSRYTASSDVVLYTLGAYAGGYIAWIISGFPELLPQNKVVTA